MFAFRYASAQHFIDVFRRFYGPVHKAFLALGAEKQPALEAVPGVEEQPIGDHLLPRVRVEPIDETRARQPFARIGRGGPYAQRGPAAEPGSAAYASRLLWFAGLTATALSLAAFALWTRNGAGILLDMMLALCG